MVRTDDNLAHLGLDSITSDDQISFILGSIGKLHNQLAIANALVNIIQVLVKARDFLGDELDHLVKEMRAVNAVLAEAVGDGEFDFLVAVFFLTSVLAVVSVQIVEPHILLGGPEVPRADFLEGVVDAIVAVFHGLDGVGAEGDAGAYFAEFVRLLVDGYGDVAVVECDS